MQTCFLVTDWNHLWFLFLCLLDHCFGQFSSHYWLKVLSQACVSMYGNIFLLHGVVCNAIWSAFGLVLMFTVPKQALLAWGTFGDIANFDLMLRTCRKTWFKMVMWVPRGPIAILRSILLQCFATQSYKIMCSGRKLRRADVAKGMFFFQKTTAVVISRANDDCPWVSSHCAHRSTLILCLTLFGQAAWCSHANQR